MGIRSSGIRGRERPTITGNTQWRDKNTVVEVVVDGLEVVVDEEEVDLLYKLTPR